MTEATKDWIDDGFWQGMIPPFQEEDIRFQFANPVVLAQTFLKAARAFALHHEQAEVLLKQVGELNVKKARAERRLKAMRREILASNFKGLAKSASEEVRDAYINQAAAQDRDLKKELDLLNLEIEEYTREIEARTPAIDILKNRIRAAVEMREFVEQYVNADKAYLRASPGVGGR